MPGVASSSPPVLIGHIAEATRTIRVGSGGVMLPNHSSLVVAEQFGMLEALHPGRIDLGIGRAPGTDQATAQALRHGGPDDFPGQLTDLLGFFTGEWPENHPYQKVHAVPGEGNGPDLWLLGSSGYSAQVACAAWHPVRVRAPLHAAEHAPRPRPVPQVVPPLGSPGEAVQHDRRRGDLRRHRRAREVPRRRLCPVVPEAPHGPPGRVPTPEEAAAYPYSDMEKAFIEDRQSTQYIGAPLAVTEGLTHLIKQTGVDELMLTTQTHDPADRLHSFKLVAAAARAQSPS